MQLPDDVWQTMKQYLQEYKNFTAPDGLRAVLEEVADIELFDGGAFIAVGNEFDLFVVPQKRGRWRIRSLIQTYLARMKQKHGKLVVKINARNVRSLRLAQHFGFTEVSREHDTIRLEN